MNVTKRREFLKNSLKLSAVAGASVLVAKSSLDTANNEDQDVLVGKSKKKEKLYQTSKSWEDYYKIAY